MKNFFLSLTVTFIVSGALAQNNVGIGTTIPAANAILELSSSNQGFLMSRLSSSDTSTVGNTEAGMLFYASDLNQFMYFDGNRWQIMDTSEPLWAENGNDIFNLNSGNIGIGTNAPFEKLEISTSLGYQGVGINTSDPNGGSFLALTNDNVSVFAQMGLNGSAHPSAPNALFFFLSNPDAIRFGTGNLERMRITGAGNIGIGTTTPPLTDNLYTYRAANTASGDFGAGRSNIHAYREGGNVASQGGTGWRFDSTDAALKGTSFWGNNFSAGIAGYNYNDYPNSTGIIGAQYNGDYWGALAFNDSLGVDWGVYTPFNSYVGRDATIGGDATIEGDVSVFGNQNIQGNLNVDLSSTVFGLASMGSGIFSNVALTIQSNYTGTAGIAYGVYELMPATVVGDKTGFSTVITSTLNDTDILTGYYSSINTNGSSGNAFAFRSAMTGAGSGIKYGAYFEGENRNYFSGSVGVGTTAPQYTLDVQNKVALYRGRFTDPTIRGIGGAQWTRIGGNGGGLAFWGNNNVDIDDSPQVFLTGAGLLGINTAAVSSQIHIQQTDANIGGNAGIRNYWNTNYWRLFHSGAHYSFEENGVRRAYVEAGTGNYVQPSDSTLKKDIAPIGDLLSRVKKLNPVSYHYNDVSTEKSKTWGFLAQEVEKEFPEIVRTSEDGKKGLSYSDFAIIAIKAIQEQQSQIEELKNEISDLKNK